jgi:hypothetical protein
LRCLDRLEQFGQLVLPGFFSLFLVIQRLFAVFSFFLNSNERYCISKATERCESDTFAFALIPVDA